MAFRARKASGLSDAYTYLRPGKKKDGIHYFFGEKEQMKYLDHKDLGRRDSELATKNLALVQESTISISESEEDLSSSRLSGAHTEASAPQTQRNHCDEIGGTDHVSTLSVDEPSLNSPARVDDEEKEEKSDGIEDLNYQDTAKFSILDSDGESDEGEGWNNDEMTGEGESYCGLDEDEPPQPDLLFKPALLQAVGGVSQIEAGSVPTELLREMTNDSWKLLSKQTPYDYLMHPYEPRLPTTMQENNPRLYDGNYGPTLRALDCLATPLGTFFYFAQPTFWEEIAVSSNDYFYEKIEERIDSQYKKQIARQKEHPEFAAKTREHIRSELNKTVDISGRELCVFIGFMVARTISPNKEKLENHWKTTDEGAIPRGCFDQFMIRDRFMHLSRNLHISSNCDDRAKTDRACKLRPVINALQYRFQRGYIPPPAMAVDEATLPSRSSFNRMRVFMKDKPHKWGTKLFMLCCSTTVYCIRGSLTDYGPGPAAVICNLREVFGASGSSTSAMQITVTDRFYTSLPLALQMLSMGSYSIRTVQTDRIRLPAVLVGKKINGQKEKEPPKNRPASIARGTFEVTDHMHVPGFRALRWWDNKAVYVLASGDSVALDRVVRRNRLTGGQAEVAYPRVLKDYQTLMGGVDIHDQLRLQRYSLQLAIKYMKYCKSLFLGLIDLALINAYIVHNARRGADGMRKLSHVKVIKQLHLELCQLREEAWEALLSCDSMEYFEIRFHNISLLTYRMFRYRFIL
ncbi:Hypothetical protein PHPALM_483 [Phytophthora palmivora]|uniref:PiggyBac transposable element-derived protein domain-containing protein n=1 Tax=Phytophthora palmivora TaxID=4796 RepID=A0A2P4YUP9_9STRA|nr:Hypothetical protein PHPALM_483 [Phytophthora palmivora]